MKAILQIGLLIGAHKQNMFKLFISFIADGQSKNNKQNFCFACL